MVKELQNTIRVAIYSIDEKYKYFITRYKNMLSTQRVCFVISVRYCMRIFYALYRNRAYIFCTVMKSSIQARRTRVPAGISGHPAGRSERTVSANVQMYGVYLLLFYNYYILLNDFLFYII